MSTQESNGSLLPKACENCRTRKIRCNKSIPCSNCTTSGIVCRPATANRESRPRILVSNNYEKQIGLIHDRLLGIEKSLKNLSLHSTDPSPSSQPSQSSEVDDEESSSAPAHFEGDSSFQQQSLQASEVAESLVGQDAADLADAIASLKSLINTQGAPPVSDQKFYFPDTKFRSPEVEILPAAFVVAIVKKVKEKTPITCLAYMFRDISELEQICQRLYFPTEPMSLGERTVMYGILYFLIQEFTMSKDPIVEQYDCEAYAKMCKKNLLAGIQTYELLAAPSYYNAIALMMGTCKAQEDGQMSLAWTLSSAAARHVQVLGYHRESTYKLMKLVEAQRKRSLFWSIYTLDKALCLVLGRASYLQDYDIDADYYQPSSDPLYRAWDASSITFTKLAKVQGQIYELLYSSTAIQKTSSERSAIVETLSDTVDQLKEELVNLDTSGASEPAMLHLILRPGEVIFSSLQTLLYRAEMNPTNGPEVSSKCFIAARKSLRAHLDCFPHFLDLGEEYIGAYVNWVLLYCSFTPFTVIFLHAIASHSSEDLTLLKSVASSLQPIRTVSKDCERLYQTCSIFCRVAETIVESRKNLPGTYNEQSDSLTFMDNTVQPQSGPARLPEAFAQDGTGDLDMDEMSMFFGNWLGSNQPVMDLLNMDFAGDMM